MSHQQVLLLVLAVFIIGMTLAVSLILFNDQSAGANRDGLTSDLLRFSVRARAYYVRPKSWGGGEKSFSGLTMDYLTSRPRNAHGTYSLVSVSPQMATLRGVGVATGNDGNPVTVHMTVFPDSVTLSLQN
ncbi:MAG: hypothetical protein WB626_05005 [Bacteroidota bacterium]